MKTKDKSGKWLPAVIAEVVKYSETHTHAETMRKYKVPGSTFYHWLRQRASKRRK